MSMFICDRVGKLRVRLEEFSIMRARSWAGVRGQIGAGPGRGSETLPRLYVRAFTAVVSQCG
jgi:hypothetical protein